MYSFNYVRVTSCQKLSFYISSIIFIFADEADELSISIFLNVEAMSKKKRNRQSKAKSGKNQVNVYPPEQDKKPISKKAFMGKKQNGEKSSIMDWFINRCKASVNGIVEDIIKWLIKLMLLYILLQLL